ncbi:MAG: hypothetical protein BWY99_02571 [Synergistetes bacterium ADurb.BinA166]|nr:MAG: hypothetical protein BWY99_02571 [Synergistetes bacterium ADurb.BinA166]
MTASTCLLKTPLQWTVTFWFTMSWSSVATAAGTSAPSE